MQLAGAYTIYRFLIVHTSQLNPLNDVIRGLGRTVELSGWDIIVMLTYIADHRLVYFLPWLPHAPVTTMRRPINFKKIIKSSVIT